MAPMESNSSPHILSKSKSPLRIREELQCGFWRERRAVHCSNDNDLKSDTLHVSRANQSISQQHVTFLVVGHRRVDIKDPFARCEKASN